MKIFSVEFLQGRYVGFHIKVFVGLDKHLRRVNIFRGYVRTIDANHLIISRCFLTSAVLYDSGD